MNIRHRETFRSAPESGALAAGARACAYLRVSTGRQAESDLSIPDQRKQVASFCSNKSWSMLAEYLEPRASAMDDSRPEFQKMVERATDDDRPFDVIVMHSCSRFFRDVEVGAGTQILHMLHLRSHG